MFPSWWHVSRHQESSSAKVETFWNHEPVSRERERLLRRGQLVRADLLCCQLQCAHIFLSVIAVTASIVFLTSFGYLQGGLQKLLTPLGIGMDS